MSGYTIVNLKDVENQGPKFGFAEDELGLRMARVGLECESSGVSLVQLGPGFRTPFGHNHAKQEEIYILIKGSARMKLADEIVELEPYTAVRVAPSTMRGYEGGPEGAEIIAIGAPSTGPGDAEIVQGWWAD